MQQQIYVVPAEGLAPRDPHTRQIVPPSGGWVADNDFWRRRILVGDVAESAPPAAAAFDDAE